MSTIDSTEQFNNLFVTSGLSPLVLLTKKLCVKSIQFSVFLFAAIPFSSCNNNKPPINSRLVTKNVFIITKEKFRWQEVFNSADSSLINDKVHTPDSGKIKAYTGHLHPKSSEKNRCLSTEY